MHATFEVSSDQLTIHNSYVGKWQLERIHPFFDYSINGEKDSRGVPHAELLVFHPDRPLFYGLEHLLELATPQFRILETSFTVWLQWGQPTEGISNHTHWWHILGYNLNNYLYREAFNTCKQWVNDFMAAHPEKQCTWQPELYELSIAQQTRKRMRDFEQALRTNK